MSSSSRHRRTERRKALPSVRPGERGQLRQELYDRHPNCHWCGGSVRIVPTVARNQQAPDDMATLEHLVPACHGGEYGPDNMVLACMRCNSVRSNYPTLLYALRVNIESATEQIATLMEIRKQKRLTTTQKWRLRGARKRLHEHQALAEQVVAGPFTSAP